MFAPVTRNFCFADSDHIEGMDTVSLQAVTLVDGSTAYIQHSPKGIERRKIINSICTHLNYFTVLKYAYYSSGTMFLGWCYVFIYLFNFIFKITR